MMRRFALACAVLASVVSGALAADPVPGPSLVTADPIAPWTFRVTQYAWLAGMNGHSTVRGRTSDFDVDFLDLVRRYAIPRDLFAATLYAEARHGPFSVFGDIAYARVNHPASFVRSRTIVPNVVGTVGAALGIEMRMTIVQAAATAEVVRWGRPGHSGEFTLLGGAGALDVYAGARYWHQRVDLDLNVVGTLQIADLTLGRGRAIARSGTVDWLDPVIGVRLRHEFSPTMELMVMGDIGGFGAGSRFSWQAVAALSFEVARTDSSVWSALVGYRALYVDYSHGAGSTRFELDMTQHGPILGLTVRF